MSPPSGPSCTPSRGRCYKYAYGVVRSPSSSLTQTHPPRGRTKSKNRQPWEFALIGSAAFSAGVTRAVSTAVIVFELSGENHLRLPLGVALMISYFIANRFTKGIYDALMDTNKTPHLEEVRNIFFFLVLL